MQRAKIIATGTYLPKQVLTNEDLERMVDTSNEWIVSRTGMKERRIAAQGEYTSSMGVLAAKEAIEKAGIDSKEIQLILVATLTPDYPFPSTACLIQSELQIQAAAMDIQAACTGYLYALTVAKAFIESNIYDTVLVIASEKLSSIVDYKDRSTCVLFGDGAAACIVSSKGKGLLIREAILGADGDQSDLLKMPGGGCRQPPSQESVEQGLHYIKMGGKETFKHAVRRMESSSKECIDRAGLQESEISWIVPHQANTRIIDAIAKRFSIPSDRVYLTIEKYGNTSASSVGIALDELLTEGKVQQGEHLLLVAFGAGLTWGSMVLTHE